METPQTYHTSNLAGELPHSIRTTVGIVFNKPLKQINSLSSLCRLLYNISFSSANRKEFGNTAIVGISTFAYRIEITLLHRMNGNARIPIEYKLVRLAIQSFTNPTTSIQFTQKGGEIISLSP